LNTAKKKSPVSEKSIGRLSLYRRLLTNLRADGIDRVFSHHLANLAGATAAQVRRDLMAIGYSGGPNRGYDVIALGNAIGEFLDGPEQQAVALVGVGNLGHALLTYFQDRRPNLRMAACFDVDPEKIGQRHACDCRTFDIAEMTGIVAERNIRVAILAVPRAAAQIVAEQLVQAGVKSLLNFTNVRLKLPAEVFVEDIDFAIALEKVAFFARSEPLAVSGRIDSST
jgi:redox-sensing transcriptional repressor